MTTARHVVADYQLTSFHLRKWELERRLREGTLEIPAVCRGLQTLIEGNLVLPNLSDLRRVQAFRLYDSYGIGEELGFSSFEEYLETIPLVPNFPEHHRKHFDRIVLVERRLSRSTLCRALGVRYEGSDDTFEPFDAARSQTDPVSWMLCHDGRRNRTKSVQTCRSEFQPFEVGLDDIEGLCAYAQDRRKLIVENKHAMDLSGSVLRGVREGAAILGVRDGGPRLYWVGDVLAYPGFGSAARLGVEKS